MLPLLPCRRQTSRASIFAVVDRLRSVEATSESWLYNNNGLGTVPLLLGKHGVLASAEHPLFISRCVYWSALFPSTTGSGAFFLRPEAVKSVRWPLQPSFVLLLLSSFPVAWTVRHWLVKGWCWERASRYSSVSNALGAGLFAAEHLYMQSNFYWSLLAFTWHLVIGDS